MTGWQIYVLPLLIISLLPFFYTVLDRKVTSRARTYEGRLAHVEADLQALHADVAKLQLSLKRLPQAFQETYKAPVATWDRMRQAALDEHAFLSKQNIVQFWDFQSNPMAHDALKGHAFDDRGMLLVPKPQHEPKWKGNSLDKPRYFEGYQFPKPHLCPGSPYECSGRGVCARDAAGELLGRCICNPPATGWDCSLTMRNGPGPLTVHDKSPPGDWCTDQSIKNSHTAKWNDRAQNCAKKNGMWLGLNQTVTRVAALSFAAALGLRPGDSLFSAGSGCGNLLQEVRAEWGNVSVGGVDFSVGGVEHSRRVLSGGQFCVADIRNMSVVPTASYDFVWTHGVVWYILEREVCGVVLDMVRIVKPGGAVLIADMRDPMHPVACQMGRSDGGGSHYKIDKLEKCVAHLGLKVDYIGMRDVSGGAYDTYCSAELYIALLRKV